MQFRLKVRRQSDDALQSSACLRLRRLLTLTMRQQHVEGELATKLPMRALDVLKGADDRPARKRCMRRMLPLATHACSPVYALLLLESLGRLLHA